MRLLMLSWRGPAHRAAGGAEEYTRQILCALARRGHTATWLCEQSAAAPVEGLHVVGVGSIPLLYLRGRHYLQRHAADFDVVIDQVNTCGFLTPLGSPVPALTFIHQRAAEVWHHHPSAWPRWLGPGAEALVLRAYRRSPFVTVSRTTLGDLRAIGWTGPAAIAYNGVTSPNRRMPKAAQPTLVFMGRWQAPGKRLADALAVHALLRREFPGVRLWVVGRGEAPRQVPAGVSFFPYADDRLRDELLGHAWLLLATSVREGWGRMVLEAAAAGTACAVYATPGLAEAATSVEGVLTAPTPAALAEAAASLLRDQVALYNRGARAAALANRFSWEEAADVWETALADCWETWRQRETADARQRSVAPVQAASRSH